MAVTRAVVVSQQAHPQRAHDLHVRIWSVSFRCTNHRRSTPQGCVAFASTPWCRACSAPLLRCCRHRAAARSTGPPYAAGHPCPACRASRTPRGSSPCTPRCTDAGRCFGVPPPDPGSRGRWYWPPGALLLLRPRLNQSSSMTDSTKTDREGPWFSRSARSPQVRGCRCRSPCPRRPRRWDPVGVADLHVITVGWWCPSLLLVGHHQPPLLRQIGVFRPVTRRCTSTPTM